MKLSEILDINSIKIPLQGKDKREVIEEMVDLLVEAGKVGGRERALAAILEREGLMSTGVGAGVALPHARSKGVKELVAAFGRTAVEIDYQALDGQPVQLIFMLLAPENNRGIHLKALSRISRMLSHENFRDFLLKAKTPVEVMEAIIQEEERLLLEEMEHCKPHMG